jgi:peptidoglycan/xylan/chitin deacetylase (PgdA/CDA1 family)
MLGTRGLEMKGLILMYHRVGKARSMERYTVSPKQFSQQMRYLRQHDFNVIKLTTLMEWFGGNRTLPERSIVISFDDGFRDTYEHACPVLREVNFPATFFLISGLVGKKNSWMTAEGYPNAALMDWDEIEMLQRQNFEIGSHTVSHRDLTGLSMADARIEIQDSKRMLEDRLGVAVDYFAYPYGRYCDETCELVRGAGYSAACATAPGFISQSQDRFRLTRVEVAGGDSLRAFAHKVTFGFNRFTYADLARYYARRITAKVLGN